MAINVLHCADLHLDAVLGDGIKTGDSEELSIEERTILRDSPVLPLDTIFEICVKSKVDAVVIAGDIFDRKENTAVIKYAQIKFSSFLSKLDKENILVFIALGNHDPLISISELKKTWPKNVYVFSDTAPETFKLEVRGEQVCFHGASYASNEEQRDLTSLFPSKVSGAYNIGVLHTNVNGNSNHSNYAPTSLSTLTSFGYDYFALGHVHKREILCEHPLVAYSGNTQGLSAKPSEREPKGCFLVNIESPGSTATAKFHATDRARYISLDLACEARNFEDITEAYEDLLRSSNLDSAILYMVRLNISIPALDYFIDEETLRIQLNEMRSNAIVTKVKVRQSGESWEKLIESEDFFARINDSLINSDLDFDKEIYGDKKEKIEQFLPKEFTGVSISDEELRTQVIELLVGTYSDLRSKENTK